MQLLAELFHFIYFGELVIVAHIAVQAVVLAIHVIDDIYYAI